mmetsp:Transcript_19990/g.55007  ORF Transcript_19990/g.55007 Transcript_19990/m.55007 type:complete len:260 (+) Transcript_19990:56-835(+)
MLTLTSLALASQAARHWPQALASELGLQGRDSTDVPLQLPQVHAAVQVNKVQCAGAGPTDGLHLAEVYAYRPDAPKLAVVALDARALGQAPDSELRVPTAAQTDVALPISPDVCNCVAMAQEVPRLAGLQVPEAEALLGRTDAHQNPLAIPVHREAHDATRMPLNLVKARPVHYVPDLELLIATTGYSALLPFGLNSPDATGVSGHTAQQLAAGHAPQLELSVAAPAKGLQVLPVSSDRGAAVLNVGKRLQASPALEVP